MDALTLHGGMEVVLRSAPMVQCIAPFTSTLSDAIAVLKTRGLSIFLASPEYSNGGFCCGGMYNGSACPTSTCTNGSCSNQPITLPPGLVMFPNTSQTLAEFGDGVVARSALGNGSTNETAFTSTPSQEQSGVNVAAIAIGTSLGVALLITVGLLLWQWLRARRLAQQLRQARTLALSPTAANPGIVDQTQRIHEKATTGSNSGSELSNETAIVELPFHKERQELQA